ncbi:glycosyltransferase [Paenibacillus albidus]|uniref:glycosyltransferase n=1 Tax=Paenibacillus albidus TaxID=2041023 RepID=UPI001BE6B627|nr:glycosyltransferase [Paenibacillus albidus]MBT2291541.1 glycosyltransferase [Paenibacillus albidus]
MQVSVIIAVYNRASLLKDLLDHWRKVDEVTKYEYELIFSDDESSDESVSILQSCSDLPIRVLTNTHGGAAKARNHAYEYATGEIVLFTGDDIFPIANFLNEHYESYLKNGKNYATLGCIEWREGIEMNHLMKHITDIGCEQFGFVGMRPFEVIDFRHFYTSNVSVSREQLQKLNGLFDPSFKKYGFEDVDLGYRLYKNGVQIMYNPDALGYHDHIYNSTEKFCKRQQSAGEEMNTLKSLHPEIGVDEMKFDIDEFHEKYVQYASKNQNFDIIGDLGRLLIYLMQKSTKYLEKILIKKDSYKIKKICSQLYTAIFSYYMYLGLAQGYSKYQPANKNAAGRYTFRYLFFGKSQIFYDKSNNFSENNSRFYRTVGEKTITIITRIPNEALGRVRFDPLDRYCKIKLKHAYAYLADGSSEAIDFNFSNAKKNKNNFYDFSNQSDPVLISEFLPENTEKVEMKFDINYMLHKRIYVVLKQSIKLSKKALKKVYHSLKHKRKSNEVQPRFQPVIAITHEDKKKVWITIKGLSDPELKKTVADYRQTCSFLNDFHIDFVPCSSTEEYSEYVYEITHVNHSMEPMQFLNAAICLLEYQYDFVILSDNLKNYPLLHGYSLKDSLLLSSKIASFEEFVKGTSSNTGRFIRIPGSKRIENEIDLTTQIPKVKIEDQTLYLNQLREISRNDQLKFARINKVKPVVFVLPVFMAVGGVERNTIEIMERLKNDFNFVVITFEKHRTEQGSLFYQVAGAGIEYYDLAEISEVDKYTTILENLKSAYNPKLVWICNSSPWMMENTSKLRRIFHNSAIVVQDVYDYEYGWIQYYDRPGIHSYDRFIAINQKIQEKFVHTYGLKPENIDLVYSAVDTQKILKAASENYSRTNELTNLNLDPSKTHFSFIGRFTEQKQPLKVLELAKYIINSYSDVDFVMVGDGELSSEVSQVLNRDVKLKSRIHRINYISEVSKFIKAMDGLVIASIFEGLPIVTIEAMCVGTPIFSTDVGDISLFVKDKNIGYVSESDDIEALKQAFDIFYAKLTEYKENSMNYTSENIEFFSSQRAADLMKQSFERALEKYNQ